jgi:hypothetical protein
MRNFMIDSSLNSRAVERSRDYLYQASCMCLKNQALAAVQDIVRKGR